MSLLFEPLRLCGKVCHIDTIVVHEKYRGKGIGRRLMKQVEKCAFEKKLIQ